MNFTEKMEVTEMISSEGETVELEYIIDTVATKGQVEKWLLDLETDMKKSVRAMVMNSIKRTTFSTYSQADCRTITQ